jgi:hypothetical protein
MTGEMQLIFMVLGIAIVFLILDRRYRIEPFLGLQGGRAQRCGLDLAPCPYPFRCVNGICRSENIPEVIEMNPLPVLP